MILVYFELFILDPIPLSTKENVEFDNFFFFFFFYNFEVFIFFCERGINLRIIYLNLLNLINEENDLKYIESLLKYKSPFLFLYITTIILPSSLHPTLPFLLLSILHNTSFSPPSLPFLLFSILHYPSFSSPSYATLPSPLHPSLPFLLLSILH